MVHRNHPIGSASNSYSPTDEERRRSYAALRATVAEVGTLRPGAVETASFLLDEAKTSFERARSLSGTLENKATMLLGVVAGASGALGVLGFARDSKETIFTPLLVAALGCAVGAILCLLYVLRMKSLEDPDIGPFISVAMLAKDNRPGLALALANAYNDMAQQQLHDVRHEPRAWLAACLATAAAAVLIVINAISYQGVAPLPHSNGATSAHLVLQHSKKATTMCYPQCGSSGSTAKPGARP